jgi:hypothetical protein
MVVTCAWSLVISSLLWRFEVRDVPDEGHRAAVGGRTAFVALVEFIVEDDVVLPFFVSDPALVRVAGAFVGGDGEDFGKLLVGYIICGLSVSKDRVLGKGGECGNIQIVSESSLYP